ncbi:hypothetical protein N7537_000995 [Penicillium hordei]|uniref:Uncharacterized protein n=1 Tax=Penicillium hordei TaxID=40994 RepID=A0AAD6EEN7_9EURO|nr:uncharacterized protein N7537_000995 [Penicillium hordei]KAJ5615881.1 hypothetical protein N7537_000995 [Penicillium hordei]
MERADEPGCPIPRTTLTIEGIDPKVWLVGIGAQFLEDEWRKLFIDSNKPLNTKAILHFGRQQILTNFYMSEFSKAFYETHFPLETLQYVIVTDIRRKHTNPFLRDHIYKSQSVLEFLPREPQTWESPSPETCGTLGTPIGKVVTAFVLCAYGQGVKRIPRIVKCETGENSSKYNLRFDIEDV